MNTEHNIRSSSLPPLHDNGDGDNAAHAGTAGTAAVDPVSSIGDSMSEIQSELRDVEEQLNHPNSTVASSSGSNGRAVFNSIRSALSNIRSRLASHYNDASWNRGSHNCASPSLSNCAGAALSDGANSGEATAALAAPTTSTALVTAAGVAAVPATAGGAAATLMQRLQNAELAHSARIPLRMLQTELSRNNHQLSPQPINKSEREAAAQHCPSDEDGGSGSSSTSGSSLQQQQSSGRVSSLFASRRRAEEVTGPEVDMDLHGTASTMMQSGSVASLPDLDKKKRNM
jgi:hypothetical protein